MRALRCELLSPRPPSPPPTPSFTHPGTAMTLRNHMLTRAMQQQTGRQADGGDALAGKRLLRPGSRLRLYEYRVGRQIGQQWARVVGRVKRKRYKRISVSITRRVILGLLLFDYNAMRYAGGARRWRWPPRCVRVCCLCYMGVWTCVSVCVCWGQLSC